MIAPYYAARGVELYLGDSRNVLADLAEQQPALRFDMLLSDPPYGQQFQGSGELSGARHNIRADGARQGVRVVRQVLEALSPMMHEEAHRYLFCHWEGFPDFYDMACAYFPIKSELIWDKNSGGMGDTELEYARDFECIIFGATGRRPLEGRRDGAVLRNFKPTPNKQKLHPTEKPWKLLSYLILKSCPLGGLVVDPFAGSASTALAALRTGRRCIAIELDERYLERAANRLRNEGEQAELFAAATVAQLDDRETPQPTDPDAAGIDHDPKAKAELPDEVDATARLLMFPGVVAVNGAGTVFRATPSGVVIAEDDTDRMLRGAGFVRVGDSGTLVGRMPEPEDPGPVVTLGKRDILERCPDCGAEAFESCPHDQT
jgi:site-specific DNA-methyltransferase (adenine-specific)